MPTLRPRITITLTKHSHAVLSRLSAASGDSMSEIVTGFVDLAVPSLERVVVVLEQARKAPKEAHAGLAAAVERAERQLLPAMQAALDQQDLFLSDVSAATRPQDRVGGLRAAQRPAPADPLRKALADARAPKATPVPVTRGSGTGTPPRARSTSSSKPGRSRG